MVTVCMTAYNQAKYLVEAVESILMQRADFKFELLIGEDLSSKDNTLEICREYELKYPHIVTVIHDGKNYGMVANEQRLIGTANGKYIAFCEADDYWIDPFKLQKQVNILEKHPEYSACACQSKIINGFDKYNYCFLSNYGEDTTFDTSYLLQVGCEFQTASFMFRKSSFLNFPPLPTSINGWDRAVFIANSFKGDIYYIAEALAVYRKNEGGISVRVTAAQMKQDLLIAPWLQIINPNLPINLVLGYLYYGVISNAITINTLNLIRYYFCCMYYLRRSEIDASLLQQKANDTLAYRLPKNLRRIFRKLGFFKSYSR